ncbi:homeobox protein NANOG [Osmerus eperlanus]|uniref:homeobox protein NANOG n=1 Tax=Osmerus eperlanus TaxID=29151 RepID=UPI002E168232
MADWKIPVNYNYNPSYHAYAYGLMYQTGSEQNNSNLPGWAEAAYQTGANGGYYSNPQLAAPQQESPPRSPEYVAVNNVHYPGPSVLYFGDSHMQTGRLFLPHNRTELDERTKVEHVNSDTPTSDSEAHTSPDSWSSGSNRGFVPQTHPADWRPDDPGDETDGGSPGNVSSSLPEEDPTPPGGEAVSNPGPVPQSTSKTKPKARAAFSDSQMTALTHRFSIQRYLTPVEMKTMARLTGLTYKQVKTWFQNRRMKLRRHQKDNSWVSERYTGPAGYPSTPTGPAGYPSTPTANQFPAGAQTPDYYTQPMREAGQGVSKLPYYSGPAAYPAPPPPSPQPGPRSLAPCWPRPPAVTHYQYNPPGYTPAESVSITSMNRDKENPVLPSPPHGGPEAGL